MPAEHDGGAPGGLSRRQLLARGAVAAGVVWAAPVIRASAAYATTSNGTERPCVNFYFVVIKPSGRCRPPVIPKGLPGYDGDSRPIYTDPESGEDVLHGVDRLPPAIEQWLRDNPAVDLKFPDVCPQLTQTSDHAWALLLPEVTGPNAAGRQCRMVIGWSRKSHSYKENTFAEGYVDPNPPLAIDVGRRLIFPCPPKGNSDRLEDQVTGDGTPSAPGAGLGSDGVPSTGIPGTSATTTTTTTTPSAPAPDAEGLTSDALSASGFAAEPDTGSLSGDGDVSGDGSTDPGLVSGDGSVSSDTDASRGPLTGDGRASVDQRTGPGACISAVYLIYCCPL